MKSFKSLTIIWILAILLLAEHIGACYWKKPCKRPCLSPSVSNNYPTVQTNVGRKQEHQFITRQYIPNWKTIDVPFIRIPAIKYPFMSQGKETIYVSKQESQHHTNQYFSSNGIMNIPLHQISSTHIEQTHNVAKQESKFNREVMAMKTIITAKKKKTLTTHKPVIPHVDKPINITKQESKFNSKHYTVKSINTGLKNEEFTAHSQVIPHVDKILTKTKHEQTVKSITNATKDLKPHVEKTPNVSQQEPKSKGGHVAKIKAEAMKSIISALRNITSTTHNQVISHADKTLNVTKSDSKSTANDSEHNATIKEEALNALINAVMDLKSHVEQTPNDSQQRSKSQNEHVDRTKSEGVKSIINANNHVIHSVSAPQTVSGSQSNFDDIPSKNTNNHFFYNTQNATQNIQTKFVSLKNGNGHGTTEWRNDVPAQR